MGEISQIIRELRLTLELLLKHPIKEAASNAGKFWPQSVGAFIITSIAALYWSVKLKQDKSLWEALRPVFEEPYFFGYPIGIYFVIALILLWTVGLPSMIGMVFCRTNMNRVSRFLMGILIPFVILYLARLSFG